ncbi:hypothetical protein ABZV60_15190 [Streptomyces sp. NPDC004787]
MTAVLGVVCGVVGVGCFVLGGVLEVCGAWWAARGARGGGRP